jgi:hypothetical protein
LAAFGWPISERPTSDLTAYDLYLRALPLYESGEKNQTIGRTADFGGLQCRLDDVGDARRHLVLKLEDIFDQTVEPIRPEMRIGERIDQLRGDTHPVATFARAFVEWLSTSRDASAIGRCPVASLLACWAAP